MYIEEALGFYLVATRVRSHACACCEGIPREGCCCCCCCLFLILFSEVFGYSESEEGRIGRWIEWRMHLSGICEYASMDR